MGHKQLLRQGKITEKEFRHLDKLKRSKIGLPLYRFLERKWSKRKARPLAGISKEERMKRLKLRTGEAESVFG